MISQVKNNLFYDHKYYHYMAASFNVLFKKTVEVNNTIWIIAYILGFINLPLKLFNFNFIWFFPKKKNFDSES
jgi:hypothetical protein